jgi:hypothetical protein
MPDVLFAFVYTFAAIGAVQSALWIREPLRWMFFVNRDGRSGRAEKHVLDDSED